MALFQNSANLTVGYNVNTPCPIDCRTVLQYRTDLINTATWSGLGNPLYTGLVSYVKEDSSLYILVSSNPIPGLVDVATATEAQKEAAYKMWVKLATSTSVEALSGVFQFKGVAESINQDQTVLTLNSASVTKGNTTYSVNCQTIGYEYDMDIYYGWGETSGSILFWTDTPTLTTSSVQYAANTPVSVTKLVLNGVDYYPVDETQPLVDGMKRWENVAGEVVYCDNQYEVYSKDTADDANLLGLAEQVTYQAYDFVPMPDSDKYTVNSVPSETVAATGNAGHVYQIGENEYASNGQIWVKLGSPVEDWIIL